VTFAILVIVTGLVFLAGDMVMLPAVMRPLFQKYLGSMVLESPRLLPAAGFYLIHTCGLVYFAGMPALREGSATTALVNGALIGLIAFACYELTNHAIMRKWHIRMVVTDMAWGTTISALSAWLGALAAIWYIAKFGNT
jgi:uncharacterized membrane protein